MLKMFQNKRGFWAALAPAVGVGAFWTFIGWLVLGASTLTVFVMYPWLKWVIIGVLALAVFRRFSR